MDKNVWPLEEGVFDRASLISLSKFVKKGIFDRMDYCIAEGKEANVYRARKADGQFVAIKMYRLRSPSFERMADYIQGDRRFSKANPRSSGIIYTWTQKEFANLKMMEELGVRAPRPVTFRHNILAMEFLGVEGIPYSTLAATGSENPNKDYELIRGDLQKLHDGGLVHADVSEYNLLMTDKGPYLIDVGQAVLTSHPRAEEFYARDLANLQKYFSKYPEFVQPGP